MIHHHRYLLVSVFVCFSTFLCRCTYSDKHAQNQQDTFSASFASTPPLIDGIADEPCWKDIPWRSINQVWLGDSITPEDFSGRYKLLWSEEFLFVLAEIRDDTLIDIHPDGLDFYWDDDCLEIFVDEDASGGLHQYNHSAFAYHIALDNRVVDIGPDSLPHYYNTHVQCSRKTSGNLSVWEAAIALYPDTYSDEDPNSKPVRLQKDKRLGFAIAYCDNDRSRERENFIGSTYVPGADKNRGWIDAGIFQPLILK